MRRLSEFKRDDYLRGRTIITSLSSKDDFERYLEKGMKANKNIILIIESKMTGAPSGVPTKYLDGV